MSPHYPWALAAAAVAAALGVAGPVNAQTQTSQQTWQPSEDDLLLLQMNVGSYKLANEIRGYQTDRGVCLDLADVIQALDLPIRLDKKSRRATGWLFSEDQTFTLDRAANRVQNVNNGSVPVNGDIFDTPEGWCVDTKALSRWFGVTLKPDLFNSAIRLESDTKLPFIEAIERRSRAARLRPKREAFDLSAYPHARNEYKMWRTPSVDAVVRVGYDSSAASKTSGRFEFYAAGEVAGASVDARLSSDNQFKPNSLRVSAFRNDAAGGMLGPLAATQIAVGDVETQSSQLTAQSAVGRGAYISNQPLGRQSRFSSTTIRGTMPSGWDAELYRNGQLIASQTDSDDGRYEFLDVDLFYGQNDLEVVLYGPQGQVRRERFAQPVGVNNVEPGKTFYWAGILQDDRDLIDLRKTNVGTVHAWRGGVGVERGLDKRTSAALGLQSLVVNTRRRNYLEGSLYRTLGSMQLELAAAHQLGAGAVLQTSALGRLGTFNLGANVTWVEGDFASEFVSEGLEHRYGFNFDTSLRLGKFILPVQGVIDRSVLRDGSKVTKASLQTAVGLRGIALTAQLQHERIEDRTPGANSSTTRLRLLANTRQFGLRLRGAASFDLSGKNNQLETIRISADKSIDDRRDITAEVEYEGTRRDTTFGLGYTHRFDRFALRTNANYSTSGSVGANLALSFSFGPDPVNGGIRFSEKKLARSGQAAVTVFRDEDGDGRRGPGEDLLKDVYVEAGLRTTDAITDETGRTIVDGLRPYIPILVGVDESSLGDPFLAPATKGIVVVPRPGVAAIIELPVAPSGEVEGTLQTPSGTDLAGVVLELLNARGAVVAATMSEYDGFFLFERVPYGKYRLRVAVESARALPIPAGIDVPVELARGKDIARMGIVRLVYGKSTVAQNSDGNAAVTIAAAAPIAGPGTGSSGGMGGTTP
ncbi:carboxypeptidase-like regulatory domain-containing protein [Allopontixanthobacter sp.]|uniref:MSCRAMM family protein n=1 Tax=Allopontixanthobacter sp. TaxID=2906452 RepID=UPI002ABAF4B5|nr:carboxypeptidase-like regulatory domain-containing protein [Allopontixanthobacter sp.]MDZ4308470.1 carboxypeptidase-like regulatory domain-containing protein [Allopontixanthobacter sp.]